MRVSLYLTQDLKYYDFLFVNGQGWFWLESTPGGPVTNSFGPFPTPLQVPAPNFLSQAQYGNTWPIMGASCDGWVIPTPNGSSAPDHGSWYSINTANGNLFRIFTFDSNNPVLIPILGSYYLANIPTFTAGGVSDEEISMMRSIKSNGAGATATTHTPLVTQEDIQTELANPLASAPCTLEQIQALIPGFVPGPSGAPLPVWTDQTYIEATTLGSDFIPYPTTVYYWYSFGQQQSIFIGLGQNSGQGNYNDRQDTCLFTDHFDAPQYINQNGQWVPSCCGQTAPGVGLPRPNWVSSDNGQIVASITGNPNFGLAPGEVMNLIACPLERGPGELALFWVWFTGDQKGVLFTEANFLNSTDHSLQLVDYSEFLQNAGFPSSVFSDPCAGTGLPACSTSAALAAPSKSRSLFGPHARASALD